MRRPLLVWTWALVVGCGTPAPAPEPTVCLDFVSADFYFAPGTPGTWVSDGVSFVNACEAPVEVRSAQVGAPFEVEPFEPFAVPPGAEIELRVHFLPTVGGAWREVLTLDTSIGPRRIAVHAEAVGPAVAVDTTTLDFGFAVPGCPNERRLAVRNEGTVELAIDAVEADSPEFVAFPVLPITLAPGGEALVVVRYEPFDDGPDAAVLRLRSGRDVVAAVNLTGSGENAEFRANPFPLTPLDDTEVVVVLGDTGTSAAAVAVRAALPDALVAAAAALTRVPSRPRVVLMAAGAGVLLGDPVQLDAPGAKEQLAAQIEAMTPFEGAEAGLDRLDTYLRSAWANPSDDAWVGSRAPVSVIVVSDAADASETPAEVYLQRWTEGWLRYGLRRSSVIVGDVPGPTCEGVASGLGYHELAVRTRGVIASVCDPDVADPVARAVFQASGLETDLPLTRPAVAGSVRVTLDDRPVEGWVFDADRGVVRFSLETAPVTPGVLRIDYTVAETSCPG